MYAITEEGNNILQLEANVVINNLAIYFPFVYQISYL
jgi:hypothetical protein